MKIATMIVCALGIANIALAAQAAPEGWQTFTDRRGACEASVPSDWKPGEYKIGMTSDDGTATVIISASEADLAMAKQVATSTFHVVKVIEDTRTRYWAQYKGNGPTAPPNDYYVALQQKGIVCAMQLSWSSGLSDADAKAIVASLRKR